MDMDEWPCGHCDKTYPFKRNLRRHMTAKHGMTLGVDGNDVQLSGDDLRRAKERLEYSTRNNRQRARDALLATVLPVEEDAIIVIEPRQETLDFFVTINAGWAAEHSMFQTVSLNDLAFRPEYPSSSTPLEELPTGQTEDSVQANTGAHDRQREPGVVASFTAFLNDPLFDDLTLAQEHVEDVEMNLLDEDDELNCTTDVVQYLLTAEDDNAEVNPSTDLPTPLDLSTPLLYATSDVE